MTEAVQDPFQAIMRRQSVTSCAEVLYEKQGEVRTRG